MTDVKNIIRIEIFKSSEKTSGHMSAFEVLATDASAVTLTMSGDKSHRKACCNFFYFNKAVDLNTD